MLKVAAPTLERTLTNYLLDMDMSPFSDKVDDVTGSKAKFIADRFRERDLALGRYLCSCQNDLQE